MASNCAWNALLVLCLRLFSGVLPDSQNYKSNDETCLMPENISNKLVLCAIWVWCIVFYMLC